MPSVIRSRALTSSMSRPLLSFSPTWVADPSVDNCRRTAESRMHKRFLLFGGAILVNRRCTEDMLHPAVGRVCTLTRDPGRNVWSYRVVRDSHREGTDLKPTLLVHTTYTAMSERQACPSEQHNCRGASGFDGTTAAAHIVSAHETL